MNHEAPTALLGLTNSEAESSILHAMRVDMNAAIELSKLLEASDFHDKSKGLVFEAISLLLLGIEPIDTKGIYAQVSVLLHERKSKLQITEALIESFDTGDPRRYTMYANTVKKLAWLRGAGDFAFWLVQELQGRPKPDTLFTEAQEKWQALAPKKQDSRFIYGWDTLKEHQETIRERVKARLEGGGLRFDWPWVSWNNRIRPLQGGFIGLFAAADGMGKTTYLEEVAEYWASKGIHVIYVHLEDNRQYKFDRRLARHARVPIANIQDGDLGEVIGVRVKEAEDKLEAWAGYLHYLDAAGDTVAQVVRELEAKVAEGVCQAVVIDYLDKFQPSRGQIQVYASNPWERQANDMEQLKVFATKNNLPIFTATQGNKTMQGGGSGGQTRQSIQGSGQKSQKAQLVILLSRDLVGEEGLRDSDGTLLAEPGQYSPIAKIRIDKQNIGQTGEFRQYVVGKYFSVRDIQIERIPLAPDFISQSEPKRGA